jgi:hypothetical protein
VIGEEASAEVDSPIAISIPSLTLWLDAQKLFCVPTD